MNFIYYRIESGCFPSIFISEPFLRIITNNISLTNRRVRADKQFELQLNAWKRTISVLTHCLPMSSPSAPIHRHVCCSTILSLNLRKFVQNVIDRAHCSLLVARSDRTHSACIELMIYRVRCPTRHFYFASDFKKRSTVPWLVGYEMEIILVHFGFVLARFALTQTNLTFKKEKFA